MNILLGYILSYGYLFFVIFVIGFLKKKIGFSVEISRKVIHMFIGFTWILLYKFLYPSMHFIVIPASFILMNAISYKFKVFKMYERSDGSDNHFGTVYYAISMTVMAIVSMIFSETTLPYGLAVFCLSFGDGAAALFGSSVKVHNPTIVGCKTVIGTVFCMIGSAVGLLVFQLFYNLPLSVEQIVLIAIISGILELVGKELDNFTVSFGLMILSWLMLNSDNKMIGISLLIAAIVFWVVLIKKSLTPTASIAAFFIVALSGICGDVYGITLLLFSYFAVALTEKIVKKRTFFTMQSVNKKTGSRDVVQVLVNGLPAVVSLICLAFLKNQLFIISYTVAITEAFSDSIASDIGVLSRKNPRSIISFKQIQPGMSGGISVLGCVASLIAVVSCATIYIAFNGLELHSILTIITCSYLGVLIDSVIGALFQAKYKCTVCDKYTEKKTHCNQNTVLVGGYKPVDNCMTNLVSNITSAIISIVVA